MRSVLAGIIAVTSVVTACSDDSDLDPGDVVVLVDAGSDKKDKCDEFGKTCFVGEGECRRVGTFECDGPESVCSATAAQPGDELCNTARDEDCDGEVDEASSGRCCSARDCDDDEMCERGSDELDEGECVIMAPAEAEPVEDEEDPSKENVGEVDPDGEDLEAPMTPDSMVAMPVDGSTMEGPDVPDSTEPDEPVEQPPVDSETATCEGEGKPCSVGVGACRREGTYSCTAAGTTCSATPGRGAEEACETSVDEDCDGVIDEAPESGCCDSTDCAAGEECHEDFRGRYCAPAADPAEPPTAEPCGDGRVDPSRDEACDPGEPNVEGLCDAKCNVTSNVYNACSPQSSQEPTPCFPGQGIFSYVVCGAHEVCTVPCVSDWQCQSDGGRASDARCLPFTDGRSYCFDICNADTGCPSDQMCGSLPGVSSGGATYCVTRPN